MNNILSRATLPNRSFNRIISFDPEDPIPTLYWSPEFSVFCDGKGVERELWGLSKRNDMVAMCKMTNVRFVDRSTSPRFRAA